SGAKRSSSRAHYYQILLCHDVYQQDKGEKALEQFEITLKEAQTLDPRDPEFERLIKNNIANSYATMGNYEMAIIKQKEILSEVEMNSELYASNQVTLGEMYFHFGNNLDAINNFNQAANTFKNLGVDNSTMLARAYNGLGLCHFGLGNYTESDEAYFNAIQVLEKNTEDNQLFYSRIFSNIAVLSHVTGD